MFCLPRNTRMRPKGKTVNIAIHLYSIAMHITFPGWCKYPWQASPPAPVGCVMRAMHIIFPDWCNYPWQASPPAPVGCVMHAAG